jgi:hypothetical protein
MATCFVMQPFDKGKYDKRYEGVFKPAILAAGLEPYRVDQDESVEMPIKAIEDGIRNATICLAEISEDNANVWFELGYALALGRPVVMVCSNERAKFPFDIAHRLIIVYKSEGPGDFDDLKAQITKRIQARLDDKELLTQVAEAQLVSEVKGISNPEVMLIASIVAESSKPGGIAELWSVRQVAERSGLTTIAFQLGLRRLLQREFVEEAPFNGEEGTYEGVLLTEAAWDWIDQNESLFKLKKPVSTRGHQRNVAFDFEDDDVPR